MELLPPVDSLWTVRQTSTWLCMSEQALRCMLRRNQIPEEAVIRIGRRVRFRPGPLRAWINRCRTG